MSARVRERANVSEAPVSDADRPRAACRERAFTLIELMVALSIFLIATAMAWASLSQTLTTRNRLEEIEDRYHGVRLAMNRIAREISLAYLSKNDVPAALEPRTFFVGDYRLDSHRLSFSYLGHQRLYANANESDTAVVTYFVERDAEHGGGRHLYRRETRRIGQEDPTEEGPAYIACEDVIKFSLEFFDRQDDQWVEEWDTKNADGRPDRLPSRVRIRLEVRDELGRSIPFVTEARTFLADPLYF